MTDTTSEAALELSNVEALYGQARALHGIDLRVEEGETVGLLGRNGAGKTTTFRSVLGLGVRRRGSVRLAGKDVSRLRAEEIVRKGVAWVPEDRRVFAALSVEENLRLAAVSSGNDRVELEPILEILPMLEPLLRRRGDELSGGEQQAVAIARALSARPRVLLLDEPGEGLAPRIVKELRAAIALLPERLGVSILVAEQNLAFVLALASRVYVLETGSLVYSGPSEEFAASPDLQDRYLSVKRSSPESP